MIPMQPLQAKLNTRFSHLVFATFLECGVDTVFIAPGSRSSPLALASKHYAKTLLTHFDERSLGFFALGAIKKEKKPMVVITTSGTAVGNLMPAIMEAYHQALPLILITADRPAEDHQVGANQTVKQTALFRDFVALEYDFEAPGSHFNERALASMISYGVYKSHLGPIHFNIPLKEPLFDPTVDFPHDVVFRKELTQLDPIFYENKKGLILLGEHSCPTLETALFFDRLAKKLHFPIFADITSGYRSYGLESVPYYPFLLEADLCHPDVILHFGKKIISKTLERFLTKTEATYLHFNEQTDLYDPYHRIDATLRGPLKSHFEEPVESSTPHSWTRLMQGLKKPLEAWIDAYPQYQEAMYIHALAEHLPESIRIFCGTSLPVRHMDTFFFPKAAKGAIYTQRGVSGIDGLISTAAGLALKGTPLLALLGDLSSLHDLSALSLIVPNKLPLIPVVFNNHGGGIFSYLPIAKQTEHFNSLIATEHPFTFKKFAEGFDLDYQLISSLEEWIEWLKTPSLYTLVEIVSSKEGNPQFLESAKNYLCSLLKQAQSPPLPSYSSTVCSDLAKKDSFCSDPLASPATL